MLRSLRTAALGMNAQQTEVDNISNNLSNANTTGFKQSNVVFKDLLYQNVQAAGTAEGQGRETPGSLQIGHGSAAVATVRSFDQGGFEKTGNQLDVAINGDGFMQVTRPDGSIAYTRDGALTLSPEGNLVTQTGLEIEPNIYVPADALDIAISQDGVVKARFQGESELAEIGQIELARFPNNKGLRAVGGNLYEQTEASGQPFIGVPGQDGNGLIRQGFLESANVDVVQEMVNLISAQRAYEVNSKMVQTSEDMLRIANNLKR